MNRKTHPSVLAWLFGPLLCCIFVLFTGCVGPTAQIATATGEQTAGNVYANAKLAKIDKTAAGNAAQHQAVKDLDRVAVDLNAFAAGTLPFSELGAVQEQLKEDGVALSGNTDAVNQITSIANIFSHAVTSVNGLVLPAQAEVQAAIKNVTSGFAIAIQTYEGTWSVSNPVGWPTPPAPTSQWLQGERRELMREPFVAYRLTR